MFEEFEFLISGIVLGFVAGISPGPLLALVFSETLKQGKIEGIKVAVAPLITDLPIVLFVLFILLNLVRYNFVIGIISLFGAVFLVYLGVENLRVEIKELEAKLDKKNGLKRGIIVNLLNPNPYLFWFFIGGPIIFRSLEMRISTTALFIVGFYSLLIGSEIGVALIVDKSKSFIKSKYYIYIIRALGLTLMLFALFFVYEGLKLLSLF
ncbi:LysE family translocator [Candidatus Bathyarchaeota archaeon]|nr:LysE family translocator [Candidatus Bathyarchaeota archaeon]